MKSSHNKQFKSDSQRMAFLLCVKFSDLGGVGKVILVSTLLACHSEFSRCFSFSFSSIAEI